MVMPEQSTADSPLMLMARPAAVHWWGELFVDPAASPEGEIAEPTSVPATNARGLSVRVVAAPTAARPAITVRARTISPLLARGIGMSLPRSLRGALRGLTLRRLPLGRLALRRLPLPVTGRRRALLTRGRPARLIGCGIRGRDACRGGEQSEHGRGSRGVSRQLRVGHKSSPVVGAIPERGVRLSRPRWESWRREMRAILARVMSEL
ncbi:hypothetical protein GCM10027167_11750 [Nocardia heshunensis]